MPDALNRSSQKIRMVKRARPIGISILAVLHLVGGVLGAIAMIFLVALLGKNPEAQQTLSQLGMPPALLIVGIVLLLGLGIASGIGMWKGKAWGWYLGSFYYLYSIIRSANALITIPMLINALPPEELANMSRGPSYYYAKHGGRVIIHFLIYLYFFKRNVREYFCLTDQKTWKPILAQLGICIGITAVASIAARMMNG